MTLATITAITLFVGAVFYVLFRALQAYSQYRLVNQASKLRAIPEGKQTTTFSFSISKEVKKTGRGK